MDTPIRDSASQRPEEFSFNIFLPEVVANPYPTYRQMREVAPLYWDPNLKVWICTNYDGVVELFRHPLLSSDRAHYFFNSFTAEQKQHLAKLKQCITLMCMFQDPPSHTRLRGLVTNAFNPRFIYTLKDKIIANVSELISSLQGQTSFDFVTALAFPLPLIVVGDLIGVRREDRFLLKEWSSGLAKFVAGRPCYEDALHAMKCFEAMSEYFTALITDRRAHPKEDFISMLVKAEDQGKILTDDEVMSMLILVLIAGHETTTNLLNNAVFHVLKRPDQLALLRQDPSLYSGLVEETLRFESPIHYLARIIKQDFIFHGTQLKQGERIMLMMGAAHRDPAHFAQPDEFQITRETKKNIAFGIGAHFCPGAPLARLESEIALRLFIEAFPQISLGLETPAWSLGALRGMKSLPLKVGV